MPGQSGIEALRCERLRYTSLVLAWSAGFIGLVVLLGGWFLNVAVLRSIIPGAATMKVNTAVCLVLAAAAVLLDKSARLTARRLAPVCAWLLILIGAATLLQDLSGRDFGIDEMIVPFRTASTGRMAVVTAICFVLLGAAMLLRNRPRALNWSQALTITATVLCIANLTGYIYGIRNFAGIVFYTGMAVHTSVTLLLLSFSLLLSRPGRGVMALLTSDTLGGVLTRRLLPASVLVPVLVGWLRWQGELRGWYGTAFGLALFATTNVIVFASLVCTAGRRLYWMEAAKTQAAVSLHASEELLKIFVQSVPAAVAMLDRNLRYLQVSDRWCADYHLDSAHLLGRSHYEIFPDIPAKWREIHRRAVAGETLSAEEEPWERADGETTWLRWEVRPWGSRDNSPEGILIFSEDITDRKRVADLLHKSEGTNRALLETAAQAILAIDPGGAIVLANRMASEIFGFESPELIGKPVEMLVPERFRVRHAAHRAGFVSSARLRPMGVGLDLTGLRKDGSEFPIEVSLSSVDTGYGILAVSFISDITARKRTEAALRESERQMRELAASLFTVLEEERRRLSRELHDDITQQLAFLSIELGRAASQAENAAADAQARIRALQQQTLRISTEVRRLSHGLHPSAIEDFGLSIALEEFCEEFAKAQDIRVRFAGPVEDSRMKSDGATCLYRIAQESLRNAVIHGRATDVAVELTANDQSISLSVVDNGTGLQLADRASKNGLGIVSMRERIRLVHGTLSFSSEPGNGTRVVASVPLAKSIS